MAMAALVAASSASLLPIVSEHKPFEPNTEAIKQRLLRKGVFPTPKILHALRKKEALKARRRANKRALEDPPPLSEAQKRALEEDSLFRTVSAEYRAVTEELRLRGERTKVLSGRPWEGTKGVNLGYLTSLREDPGDGRLRTEHLEELRRMLAERNDERFRWLLANDEVEETDEFADKKEWKPPKSPRMVGDEEKIRLLVERLSSSNINVHDWKFSRIMKQSGLYFTEMYLLKLVEQLGNLGKWSQAQSVVEWVYNEKDYKHKKSRFVYTKLLSVLGKARRPTEALHIFNKMREDGQLYPDMAAYHCIAVALGQAGLVHELIKIIDCMKQKPSKKLRNMNRKNWDPCLEPDVIIYNSVLNACIPSHQWKGVFWVLEQMRHSGLKPIGATYGLAMEVMLKAGKYDLVYKFFQKMKKGGIALKALTYKVLVRAFWEEGKVDDAIEAVREMEERGIVGAASVYYELACCLCNKGRWQDAMIEGILPQHASSEDLLRLRGLCDTVVEKLKKLPLTKPLEMTFTGMILSSLDGGHIPDCISIFQQMKYHCSPNIGTINAMLKVYSSGDMFASAKKLFEATKAIYSGLNHNSGDASSLDLDVYSYKSMLEASASAQQWDYFEYVYKEMILSGFELDHKKNSWLLVKASRAGKWHLLEHAFDTVLEAEEIPHMSLFTEMIFQSIGRQDFGRTANLLNGMVYASLTVSEIEWRNLLQRDLDRFSTEKLQDLLNHLESSNLVMEDPVPNFLKSLQYVCGARLLNGTITNTSSDIASMDKSILDGDDLESDDKNQSHRHAVLPPGSDDSQRCTSTEMFNAGRCMEEACLQEKADNSEVQGMDSYSFGQDFEPSRVDATLDLLTSHAGTPFAELPPASEILEKWREDRIKNARFTF